MISTFWEIPGIQSHQSLDLFERSLNPLCVYEIQGRPIYASPSFLKLLQVNIQDVHFFDYFSSQMVTSTILTQFWHQAKEGETIEFISKVKETGEELDCSLQFDPNAKLMFLTVEKTDAIQVDNLMQDYDRAIAALIRTEEKWKTLVLNSPYLFIQISHSGQILYLSAVVEKLLGYEQQELLGQSVTQLIHPASLHEFELMLQLWIEKIPSQEPGIESWWKTKSGQWVALYIQGQHFPSKLDIEGVVLSGYDITDRKCLEAELKAAQDRYQSLLYTLPGAVFRCNSTYTLEFASDTIEAITGYPPQVLVHNQMRSYLSLVHPDDLPLIKKSLLQSAMDRHRCIIEYRIIHADGSIRWVAEHKQARFDRDGNFLGLEGVLLDISDRKSLEAERNHAAIRLQRCKAINRSILQQYQGVVPTTLLSAAR
jgi:PAS domain S-box-containing protein